MTRLIGKLEFISFWNPIKLETENGMVDLREAYFQVFNNLNGKKTSMEGKMHDLAIFADESSEKVMVFEKNDKEDTILMVLEKPKPGFGMSNLGAYVPMTLQSLNGLRVIVEYDEHGIKIEHDPTEKVYELNYTNGNSCRIPDDKVKEICRLGHEDACIFCSVGSKGFECQKFDSFMSRMILDRHSKGTMNAKRIGNCMVVGRIDD